MAGEMTGEMIEVVLTEFPVITAFTKPAKFRAALKLQYNRAALVIGRSVAAMMRRTIRGGVAPPNAPMTTDMKGSSKPLVDRFQLGKAITHKVSGPYNNIVAVGVMRTHAKANVALIVSEGTTITVTKRMALLFKILNAASRGRPVKVTSARGQELLAMSKHEIPALNEGTILTIPPRPFADITAKNPALKELVVKQYKAAIARAIEQMKSA